MNELYPGIALIIGLFLMLGSGCHSESTSGSQPTVTIEGRWFTKAQYELGKTVYTENCARCHGTYGQSTVDNWKRLGSDGLFPPPPLNGTAHTWHHPFEILMKTINEGGAPLGGTMPAFADSLSDEEKIAVIAYFQSWWDAETYDRWVEMNAGQ
jgi:mono/diheme cytochrome c family protein